MAEWREPRGKYRMENTKWEVPQVINYNIVISICDYQQQETIIFS